MGRIKRRLSNVCCPLQRLDTDELSWWFLLCIWGHSFHQQGRDTISLSVAFTRALNLIRRATICVWLYEAVLCREMRPDCCHQPCALGGQHLLPAGPGCPCPKTSYHHSSWASADLLAICPWLQPQREGWNSTGQLCWPMPRFSPAAQWPHCDSRSRHTGTLQHGTFNSPQKSPGTCRYLGGSAG